MVSGSGDLCIHQWWRVAATAITVALTACQAMPPFRDEPERDAAASQALVELRSAHAACETHLSAALQSHEELGALLISQNATLAEMQGALGRVESRINKQNSVAAEAKAAPACKPQSDELPRKLLVGRREQVWIEPLQMTLPARIDTGAETASLDARNIEEFERNGNAWVRFDIVHPENGEAINMEREVSRFVRILQSSADKPERRAVIEFGIVIGNIRQEAEFTLSDRSHLDFQVLVGRNIL
ncbi:MAG: RimK/LysX family protein, partial [Chromatocurvus sp.]